MANAVGEGVMEKFRRANMHREDFERRIAGFVNRRPHQIVRYDDLDAGRRIWRIEVREQPPLLEESSEFPIFYRRDPLASDRRIGGIHPDARNIIESMQPHGRDDRTVLGYLEALHNFDKHRTTHIVAGFPSGVSHWGETPFDFIDFSPFVDGQIVASGPIPTDPEVDNDPGFTFDVAFANEGPCKGYPVRLILNWISQHIENGVFPLLAPYL